MPSPSTATVSLRLPSTESYFSRWASVPASVMSFTATISIWLSPFAARMMFRPMRPNPLIPTRVAMCSPETTRRTDDEASQQTFYSSEAPLPSQAGPVAAALPR